MSGLRSAARVVAATVLLGGTAVCQRDTMRTVPALVYDDGLHGEVWLVSADLAAYDACRVHASATDFVVSICATFAEQILESDGAADPLLRVRQSLTENERARVAAWVAGASKEAKKAAGDLLAVTSRVHGPTVAHFTGVLQDALKGYDSEVSPDGRYTMWPRFPDYLRDWKEPRFIDGRSLDLDQASSLLESLLVHVDSATQGSNDLRLGCWRLLAEIRARAEKSRFTGIRTQNLLGLVLLQRAIEDRSLVDGAVWGSELHKADNHQAVVVEVSFAEMQALQAFARCARSVAEQLRAASTSCQAVLSPTAAARVADAAERCLTEVDALCERIKTIELLCQAVAAQTSGQLELARNSELLCRVANWRLASVSEIGKKLSLNVYDSGASAPRLRFAATLSYAGAAIVRRDGVDVRLFALPVTVGDSRYALMDLWR